MNEQKIDCLYRTVNHLRARPMFLVVLSTQLDMKPLAPSGNLLPSSRMLEAPERLNPPLTESPFDHRLQDINESRMNLELLADPIYMALYGRPLYVCSRCFLLRQLTTKHKMGISFRRPYGQGYGLSLRKRTGHLLRCFPARPPLARRSLQASSTRTEQTIAYPEHLEADG